MQDGFTANTSEGASLERARKFFTERRAILLSLILFVLIIRLLSMMMIHTGVDERDYWFSAKRLLLGLPYDVVNHRTVRFGVILPVLLVQAVAGVHPNVYYLAPLALSVIQIILIFRLGERLHSRLAGVLASVALALFPYMIRGGSQVRPGIFSLTYLLLSLGFLLDYLEGRGRPRFRLTAAALLLFVAYQSKITNLYFLPGILLSIILFGRKNVTDSLLFCSILLVLYVLETLAFWRLFGEPLGRLGVIVQNHLQADYIEPMRIWGLLGRYRLSRFPAYWLAVFLLFFPAAWFLRRWRRKVEYRVLTMMVLGFLFFITVAVSRLRPVVPVEPFHHRFFMAALGPALLLDAIFILEAWRRLRGIVAAKGVHPGRVAVVLGGVVLVIGVLFSSGLLPRGLALYFNDLRFPDRHPLALNRRYAKLINDAGRGRTPFLARESNAGSNALSTVTHYFLDRAYLLEHGLPPLAPQTIQGASVLTISWPGTPAPAPGQDVILATRAPFHVERVGLDKALRRTRPE